MPGTIDPDTGKVVPCPLSHARVCGGARVAARDGLLHGAASYRETVSGREAGQLGLPGPPGGDGTWWLSCSTTFAMGSVSSRNGGTGWRAGSVGSASKRNWGGLPLYAARRRGKRDLGVRVRTDSRDGLRRHPGASATDIDRPDLYAIDASCPYGLACSEGWGWAQTACWSDQLVPAPLP